MKNQYFGDVNDYRKYGLLKVLSGGGKLSTGVCWMLTPSDGRNDGQMLRYLEHPSKWRHFDPDLFDFLKDSVIERSRRDVHEVEASSVLPNTAFFARLLEDRAEARRTYFAEMLSYFRNVNLIFLDPDNGFEVQSVPYGRKNANKFLFWREFTETYQAGHSVLVYQHFARINRTSFIERMAERMQEATGSADIYAFATPHVVFLLAPRPEHLDFLNRQAELIPKLRKGQINFSRPLVKAVLTEPTPETF